MKEKNATFLDDRQLKGVFFPILKRVRVAADAVHHESMVPKLQVVTL